MTLKPKKILDSPLTVEAPDPWSGPWGRINPAANASVVVRFRRMENKHQETHSYPYRMMASWHWTKAEHQEELRIAASGDTITIKGVALDRIVDALDQGKLEMLCETESNTVPREEAPIWISSIAIETA